MTTQRNLYWRDFSVTREDREKSNGHKSFLLWFTGLSGAGKSTIAQAVNLALYQRGLQSYVLDGDNIRHNLCSDLGFSQEDRSENIRRIGEVAKLLLDNGTICIAAFISPLRIDRARVRNMLPKGAFIEVYCDASLHECERRDVKGLYKKARTGQIPDFTGISAPYEAPVSPELTLPTGCSSTDDCVQKVFSYFDEYGALT